MIVSVGVLCRFLQFGCAVVVVLVCSGILSTCSNEHAQNRLVSLAKKKFLLYSLFHTSMADGVCMWWCVVNVGLVHRARLRGFPIFDEQQKIPKKYHQYTIKQLPHNHPFIVKSIRPQKIKCFNSVFVY